MFQENQFSKIETNNVSMAKQPRSSTQVPVNFQVSTSSTTAFFFHYFFFGGGGEGAPPGLLSQTAQAGQNLAPTRRASVSRLRPPRQEKTHPFRGPLPTQPAGKTSQPNCLSAVNWEKSWPAWRERRCRPSGGTNCPPRAISVVPPKPCA